MKIELGSCGTLGGSGQMTAPANYTPAGLLGTRSSSEAAGAAVALCSLNSDVRVCECGERDPAEGARFHSTFNIPSRHTGLPVGSALRLIASPSPRRLNYSWNETSSPSREKMKDSCYSLVSPPFFFPSSRLKRKDDVPLFVIPPSPSPSFGYVLAISFLFFSRFTVEKVIA